MSKFATNKSRFERPSSVQELNGELYVKGAKKDAVKQIKVDAPSGLNVAFDGASTVTLNWSGPAEVDAYAASYKATDGSSGSLSINGTTATLGGIKPGVTYSFSVVAKKVLEQAQQLVHPSLRLAELQMRKKLKKRLRKRPMKKLRKS
ncbi:fibronectin type III domain-containing protein [Bacillus anthracis]|nr:fibronectin type III domain-containing protein [Bacillus anthracis]